MLSNTIKPFLGLISLLIVTSVVFNACNKNDDKNNLFQSSEDNANVQDLFNDLSTQANMYENGNKSNCPTVTIINFERNFKV